MVLTKHEKEQLIKEFGQTQDNSGAVEVQVALMTQRINQLTEHLKEHRKDFSSKRGLLKLVVRRRISLQYLKRRNTEKYLFVVERLQLKELK
jgi:small subunit ribosomal protein S15